MITIDGATQFIFINITLFWLSRLGSNGQLMLLRERLTSFEECTLEVSVRPASTNI
jgi:hypothetical protein